MSKVVTLASMVAKVRSYADLVANDFRTDAQIQVLIQAKAEELHEELVKSGHHWALTFASVSTVAGTQTVAVPTAALEVMGVDRLLSGTDYVQLEETSLEHRYDYGTSTGAPVAWSVEGTSLVFYPIPDAVYTIKVWYVPVLGTLTDAAPAVQLDSVHGWDEYVCWAVAADLKGLQELDPSYQAARAAEQHKRVIKMAQRRVPTARKLVSRRYTLAPRRTLYVR